jgi:hypothetical protein
MQAAVGAGATVDVQPPAGHEYLIRDVAGDAAFVGAVPEVQVAIRDGVLADAIVWIDPTTTPNKRGRQLELYLTNTNYMRLTNTAAGANNVSWFGREVRPGLSRVDLVNIAGGATVNIQPPAGEVWRITEIGASVWTAAYPDVNLIVTDGVLVASLILDSTMARGQEKALNLYIDNVTYLAVTDTSGGGLVFGYSGVRVPETCISSVTDVAGSATLDIIPPANQEWVITEISAETWAGVAPNGYPDILVSMMVGANLSDLLEPGAGVSLRWNTPMSLEIDTTHYLRITEISTADNEVGVLGYLKRSWS